MTDLASFLNNAAKLHLMINTLPPVVSCLAAAVLGMGILWRSNDLRRFGLVLMVSVPLLIVPVFFTGRASIVTIGNMPGVPLGLIGEHQESVAWTWTICTLSACAALAALITYRRRQVPARAMAMVLALSLVTDGFLLRTAHLGGRIRHPEVRRSAPQ